MQLWHPTGTDGRITARARYTAGDTGDTWVNSLTHAGLALMSHFYSFLDEDEHFLMGVYVARFWQNFSEVIYVAVGRRKCEIRISHDIIVRWKKYYPPDVPSTSHLSQGRLRR